MKENEIPKTDTISRYCPFSKMSEEGKPLGAAFMLRDFELNSGNPHISVNWLEFFKGKNKEEQIDEIRNILLQKMSKIGGKAKLALINVKQITSYLENEGFNIRIIHWPDITENYSDESHAGIFDVEKDPDVIADMIAQNEWEMLPAKL